MLCCKKISCKFYFLENDFLLENQQAETLKAGLKKGLDFFLAEVFLLLSNKQYQKNGVKGKEGGANPSRTRHCDQRNPSLKVRYLPTLSQNCLNSVE